MSTPGSARQSPASPLHPVLPAGDFYWAILDEARATSAAVGPRSVRRAAERRYAFEDVLPVPVDGVSSAFLRAGDTVIACGLPVDRVVASIGPHTRTLCPDAIPAWVLDAAGAGRTPPPSPRRLNLLTQTHEPPSVRRARRRQVLHAAGIMACLLAILAVGIERHIAALAAHAADANRTAAAAYARVLPTHSTQPPAVRLASELRLLERLTIRPPAGQPGTPRVAGFDAAIALSELLALVPDMHLACESLDITSSRATLIATVSSPEDAQLLAAAFDRSGPWQVRQPQVSAETAPDGQPAVRITITLEPTPSLATPPEGAR